MKNWLDKYNDGGYIQPNNNESNVSLPPGFKGWGYNTKGDNYNPAWNGPVTRMGGTIPGATGMMYGRTSGLEPLEPKKAQKGRRLKRSSNPETREIVRDNIPTNLLFKLPTEETIEQIKNNEIQRMLNKRSEVVPYVPQSLASKTLDVVTNPMTALGYIARGEDIPDNFTAGPRNATDYALDFINPAQYALDATNLVDGTVRGDLGQIGEGILGIAPFGLEAKNITKNIKKNVNKSVSKVNEILEQRRITNKFLNNPDVRVYDSNATMANPTLLREEIQKGAETLDEALDRKIQLLKTPEGRERLIRQEANYIAKLDLYKGNRDHILKQAEINADARIFELEHMRQFGNLNEQVTETLNNFFKKVKPTLKQESDIINAEIAIKEFPLENAFYHRNFKVDFDDIPLNKYPQYVGGSQNPGQLALGTGFTHSRAVADHEISHALQKGRLLPYDLYLKNIEPSLLKTTFNKHNKNAYNYFDYSAQERTPFLNELRRAMINRGIINHEYDRITPKILSKAQKSFAKKPMGNYVTKDYGDGNFVSETRILDFMKASPSNFKIVSEMMNRLPQVATPIIGGAAAASMAVNEFQDGGVIKDNRGQWAHPGKITQIDSNNITMQGVPYPVLGISDTGDTKMMMPNQDYKFQGNSVTEYPMAQKGKTITVNSKEDPRYKAYQDSLALYNNYNDLKKELISQNYKPKRELGRYSLTGYKEADLYDELRKDKDRKDYYKKTGKGNTKMFLDIREESSSLKSVDDFIHGQVNKTLPRQLFSETIKPIEGLQFYQNPSTKDGRYVAKYKNVKPIQEVIYKPDIKYDTTRFMEPPPLRKPISRKKVKNITNLIKKDFVQPEMSVEDFDIYVPAVDYWNVTKEVNQNFGGSKSSFKVHNKKELERIKKRQEIDEKTKTGKNNKLIIEPVYSNTRKVKSSAKNGSLVELNQLTNFTNYNTPQPGGWLDKYN